MNKHFKDANLSLAQGFRSATFYPADKDHLDTDIPENAIKFKTSRRKTYQHRF
jgi:hypothetical protein